MICVLDASAAIEIALNREHSTAFREALRQSDLVVAPDLFASEITNVFWKYAAYADMPAEVCEKGIDYCLDLIDDYIDTRSLCREVFSEAYKNNHSAYDLFYLVTARRYNASLLTRDAKMKDIAAALKIAVLGFE